MREFHLDEAGHSDSGAAVAVMVAVLVLVILVMYMGGLFGGVAPRDGVDINIRQTS